MNLARYEGRDREWSGKVCGGMGWRLAVLLVALPGRSFLAYCCGERLHICALAEVPRRHSVGYDVWVVEWRPGTGGQSDHVARGPSGG